MYPKIQYDGHTLYYIPELCMWCLPIEDIDKINYIVQREYIMTSLKERIQDEAVDIIINKLNDKMK